MHCYTGDIAGVLDLSGAWDIPGGFVRLLAGRRVLRNLQND